MVKLIWQDYCVGLSLVFNVVAYGLTKYLLVILGFSIKHETNLVQRMMMSYSYFGVIFQGMLLAFLVIFYLNLRSKYSKEDSIVKYTSLNLFVMIIFMVLLVDVVNDIGVIAGVMHS
jgi:hypothetical protein